MSVLRCCTNAVLVAWALKADAQDMAESWPEYRARKRGELARFAPLPWLVMDWAGGSYSSEDQ